MKRKPSTKLQLSKETLVSLDDKQAALAVGGSVAATDCLACPSNHTRPCTICCP